MREFKDLTYRGKLRRIRRVAQSALEAFGIDKANLRFIRDNGNTIYRVKTKENEPIDESLYVTDCFALRLHWTGYHEEAAVDSELEWLAALSDEGLPVPQPLRTLEGKLTTKVSIPEVPGTRQCSIIRWMKGRQATKSVYPWHLKAIGRLIAQFHDHASRWKPPEGFTRRHYDTNGLWGDDTGTGYTAAEVWPNIPKQYMEDFQEITQRVQQLMDRWGKDPEVFGLIHADLGTKANVLFHKGRAHAIDFDDSVFGYWIYDIAIPLSDWEGNAAWPAYREALLDGYQELRTIPEEQLSQLELFQAAIRGLEIFWGTASDMRYPGGQYWIERREEAWKHLHRYLKENPQ